MLLLSRLAQFTYSNARIRICPQDVAQKASVGNVAWASNVGEDGYEFFAGRELVTVFSAPNYCGEFDNAGAMMTVDDTLMCSFQILKPASAAQQRGGYGGRAGTPGRR